MERSGSIGKKQRTCHPRPAVQGAMMGPWPLRCRGLIPTLGEKTPLRPPSIIGRMRPGVCGSGPEPLGPCLQSRLGDMSGPVELQTRCCECLLYGVIQGMADGISLVDPEE